MACLLGSMAGATAPGVAVGVAAGVPVGAGVGVLAGSGVALGTAPGTSTGAPAIGADTAARVAVGAGAAAWPPVRAITPPASQAAPTPAAAVIPICRLFMSFGSPALWPGPSGAARIVSRDGAPSQARRHSETNRRDRPRYAPSAPTREKTRLSRSGRPGRSERP